MKKSELIKAIQEALLPEIDKMLTKKVAAAAKKIIQENRKNAKPVIEKEPDVSLSTLMKEQNESNPVASTFKKKTFTKNKMLNSILNETAEQQQEWKMMNGGEYTSNMAQAFQSANPMSAFEQKPTVQNMVPEDRQGRNIPDAVASALTKDYSALVKSDAFNKRIKK